MKHTTKTKLLIAVAILQLAVTLLCFFASPTMPLTAIAAMAFWSPYALAYSGQMFFKTNSTKWKAFAATLSLLFVGITVAACVLGGMAVLPIAGLGLLYGMGCAYVVMRLFKHINDFRQCKENMKGIVKTAETSNHHRVHMMALKDLSAHIIK